MNNNVEFTMNNNVEFIRVLHDLCTTTETRRQALFRVGVNYYMYSYVNNLSAHETMVFSCDANGENVNYSEVYLSKGYVESDAAMQSVERDYGHLSEIVPDGRSPVQQYHEDQMEKIAAADADEKIASRKIAENNNE